MPVQNPKELFIQLLSGLRQLSWAPKALRCVKSLISGALGCMTTQSICAALLCNAFSKNSHLASGKYSFTSTRSKTCESGKTGAPLWRSIQLWFQIRCPQASSPKR